MRRAFIIIAVFAGLTVSNQSWADDAPPPVVEASPQVPRLHHGPISTAPADIPLRIMADVDYPERMAHLTLVYRRPNGQVVTLPMLRASEGYVAEIPGSDMKQPGVAYAIELEQVGGAVAVVFASRRALHPVQVVDDDMNTHERELLDRMGGKRSVAAVSGDYVRFGRTNGLSPLPCNGQGGCAAGKTKTPEVLDEYWRTEGSYTYRPFRTVAEFSLKAGVLRGTSLVDTKAYTPDRYSVGSNYAAPTVTLRIVDALHLESELLTSITEVGFSLGGGNTVTIGDLYGTNLAFGWEAIGFKQSYFGSRFFTKMNVDVIPQLRLSPALEVTDMPHAETFGLRILGEATVKIGHSFQLGFRGGYQARRAVSGGPSLGSTLALAF